MRQYAPDISSGSADVQQLLLLNILSKVHEEKKWDEVDGNLEDKFKDIPFKTLLRQETSYLKRAMNLLHSNPILQQKYGGMNIDSANSLAKDLKARTDTREIEILMEPAVVHGVSQKYNGGAMPTALGKAINPFTNYGNLYAKKDVNGNVVTWTPYFNQSNVNSLFE